MSRQHRVLIVGASLAGLRAAESLRDAGFDGPVTLVGDELHLPYDRPPLSKTVLSVTDADRQAVTDKITLRQREWFTDHDITLLLGQRARRLDLTRRTLQVGQALLRFDKLLIATGSRACASGLPDLPGVLRLRTRTDAERLQTAFAARPRLVILGGGFIGGEVASSARTRGLPTTVVEAAARPMGRLGASFADEYAALHAGHDVRLLTGRRVAAVLGTSRVEAVQLTTGETVPADVLVDATGSAPNTEWLAGSGLDITDGVLCDATLQAAPDVYAAGDVARWPNQRTGQTRRVEHWTNAVEQGRAVGRRLAGADMPDRHESTPYFWSDQHGSRIQFAGELAAVEECRHERLSGDPHRTLTIYRSADTLCALASIDRPADFARLRHRLARPGSWRHALATLDSDSTAHRP